MNYLKSIFGKEINAISEQDILTYFQSSHKESDQIEYKSYNPRDNSKESEKITKIVRSVAAMLNSSGGIIFWGAPMPVKDELTGEHVVQGALTPVDISIGADRFMEIIVSNITPSPDGVYFAPIKLSDRDFIYLIEVRASSYPPHQYDGRYFARFDSLTKPAPHHYIEALMKQVRQPKIEAYINFGTSYEGRNHVVAPCIMTLFNTNRSIPAFNLQYEILHDGELISFEENLKNNAPSSDVRIIKSKSTGAVINNRNLVKDFLIYAKVMHNENRERKGHISLYYWADNVPLTTCRYLVTQKTNHNMSNLLSVETLYENQFAADISLGMGKTEGELIKESRINLMAIFQHEYLRSPFIRNFIDQ